MSITLFVYTNKFRVFGMTLLTRALRGVCYFYLVCAIFCRIQSNCGSSNSSHLYSQGIFQQNIQKLCTWYIQYKTLDVSFSTVSQILYMMKYLIFNNYRNDFTLNIQQSVLDQYKRKFRYALKAILLLDVKDKKPIN